MDLPTTTDEFDDMPHLPCVTTYAWGDEVCGSDGENYADYNHFLCEQRRSFKKGGNLQYRHDGLCWIWEEHGYETHTVLLVSKISSISIDDYLFNISL